MNANKGLLLVVSGPSGVGKGTVCKYLAENETNIFLSVSATSRQPREGEVDGQHYYFVTQKQFDTMIENDELLEYAKYISSCYGTPKKPCFDRLNKGDNVILEIEVQGGTEVKEKYPETVMIFMVPPNMDILKDRLAGRGTETEEAVEQRIKRAYEEFGYLDKYDYIVVNDDVIKASERIKAIICAEKQKVQRITDNIKKELKI
ncbi:MAG: guanylate kinase [Clostridia bacterium]|nr:guanylate kinase [Clostridia bacterium]